MKNQVRFTKLGLRVLLFPVIASIALSACATTTPQMIGWDHVRDGLNERIYTGDDHI